MNNDNKKGINVDSSSTRICVKQVPFVKLMFLQDFEGLTEVFAPDVRQDVRVDVRRICGPRPYSLGCFFVLENFRNLQLHTKMNPRKTGKSNCIKRIIQSKPKTATAYLKLILAY